MSGLDLARQSVSANCDGGHGVEPQEREVGEVVARERLALEVGVNETQTAESRLAGAGTADVGQKEAAGLANQHPFDLALAAQEDAELASGLERKLTEVAGQFAADQLGAADAAAIGRPQSMQLRVLEAESVAE
jgi:hypothetical protein